MSTVKKGQLKRIYQIKVNNQIINLEDPNPKMSSEDIRDLYSNQYPQLTNSTIVNKGIEDGKSVFEFITVAGTKG